MTTANIMSDSIVFAKVEYKGKVLEFAAYDEAEEFIDKTIDNDMNLTILPLYTKA
jgi:hypothetical protein